MNTLCKLAALFLLALMVMTTGCESTIADFDQPIAISDSLEQFFNDKPIARCAVEGTIQSFPTTVTVSDAGSKDADSETLQAFEVLGADIFSNQSFGYETEVSVPEEAVFNYRVQDGEGKWSELTTCRADIAAAETAPISQLTITSGTYYESVPAAVTFEYSGESAHKVVVFDNSGRTWEFEDQDPPFSESVTFNEYGVKFLNAYTLTNNGDMSAIAQYSVTIRDTTGQKEEDLVAPVARMDIIDGSVRTGVPATFSVDGGGSESNIARYVYHTDNGTQEGRVVDINFNTPGAHSIQLVVQDENGLWSEPVTKTVFVQEQQTREIIRSIYLGDNTQVTTINPWEVFTTEAIELVPEGWEVKGNITVDPTKILYSGQGAQIDTETFFFWFSELENPTLDQLERTDVFADIFNDVDAPSAHENPVEVPAKEIPGDVIVPGRSYFLGAGHGSLVQPCPNCNQYGDSVKFYEQSIELRYTIAKSLLPGGVPEPGR